MAKIQFNCRLEEDVAAYIAGEAIRKGCSQADLITVWANRSSVGMTPKLSKKAVIVAQRAASDLTGAHRDDIDYSDTESQPGTHILDATGPSVESGRGKATVETWRANRRPLLKPGAAKKARAGK